jgi:hypothetical protein
MWTCPECKNRNPTLADYCCVCGLSPDGQKPPPLREAVGVTRRFSVGTFMIMSALLAVLFSVLTVMGAHPIVFGCIVVFFTGIGVAQMFVFHGEDPRKASWIAGIPLGFFCGLAGSLIARWTGEAYGSVPEIIGAALGCTIIGGPCGYIAGCLVAGIFLVREREEDEGDTQETIDESDEDED